MSKKLNGGNFGLTIGTNEKVVVYFWATWCMPCNKYSETYELVCGDVDPDIIMGKFDVDESKDVAVSSGVKDMPCIQIYKSGVKVAEIIGVNNKQDILQEINKHL